LRAISGRYWPRVVGVLVWLALVGYITRVTAGFLCASS
jgi:hypothetical protein